MDVQLSFHLYLERYKTKSVALFHALKDAIVSGKLPYQSKLPSTRALAGLYLLSRGTVNQVYEMLAAEGYVAGEVGSGTFVAFRASQQVEAAEHMMDVKLSDWGKRVQQLNYPMRMRNDEPVHRGGKRTIEFVIGKPALTEFPTKEWNRFLYAEVREQIETSRNEVVMAGGHLALRQAIANYLLRARGITALAEDIVILNGSMQAIALLIQLLVNPGDAVVVENPGYGGVRRAVEAVGGRIVPAPVDHAGIVLADWEAQLLFVTPSRQYPTGAVLSLERRQAILLWAEARGAIVIEDDYDSEFRHQGRPIEPLKVLDQQGRVVYIGTFSRTMLPDLRLGYAVLPAGLRDCFLKAKQLFELLPTALVEQRALAAFMNSGQYERHLRRMKRVYGRRYELLWNLFRAKLSHLFEPVISDSGLHMFVWWKRADFEWAAFRAACREAGVLWTDGAAHYIPGTERPSACFGYSHLRMDEIEAGVEIMAQVWKTFDSQMLLRTDSSKKGINQ